MSWETPSKEDGVDPGRTESRLGSLSGDGWGSRVGVGEVRPTRVVEPSPVLSSAPSVLRPGRQRQWRDPESKEPLWKGRLRTPTRPPRTPPRVHPTYLSSMPVLGLRETRTQRGTPVVVPTRRHTETRHESPPSSSTPVSNHSETRIPILNPLPTCSLRNPFLPGNPTLPLSTHGVWVTDVSDKGWRTITSCEDTGVVSPVTTLGPGPDDVPRRGDETGGTREGGRETNGRTLVVPYRDLSRPDPSLGPICESSRL